MLKTPRRRRALSLPATLGGPPRHLGALWAALSCLVLLGSSARAEIAGTYQSALGKVAITEKGGSVVGKLVGKSPCGFKRGTVVLKGDRLDDSITGEVKTCKIGKGCSGKLDGLAMLLITRGGSVISGYVHADAGKCQTPLKQSAVAFKRKAAKRASSNSTKKNSGDTTPTDDADSASGSDQGTKVAKAEPNKGKRRRSRRSRRARSDRGSKDRAPPSSTGNTSSKTNASSSTGQHNSSGAGGETDNKASGSGRGTVTGSQQVAGGSLDEGEPPVSPGPEARMKAEALASQGMQLIGEPTKARARFEEAIAVDPAYAEGWLGIGVTYYLTDRYEDAEESYKRALEANPAIPDAYYNLACLYALQGDKEKAFNYLRIAVLNGFVDFTKVDEDPDLNSLHDDERYTKFRSGQLW